MATPPKSRSKASAKPQTRLVDRTPVLEWGAAALGLILTLSILAYLVREGLMEEPGPPALLVAQASAIRTDAGFVLPVTVTNSADETAAAVEVRGVLLVPGAAPEERRAAFAYVPGKGEARGGLVFSQDPASGGLTLSVEGYAEP